jgi:hypothetical protein
MQLHNYKSMIIHIFHQRSSLHFTTSLHFTHVTSYYFTLQITSIESALILSSLFHVCFNCTKDHHFTSHYFALQITSIESALILSSFCHVCFSFRKDHHFTSLTSHYFALQIISIESALILSSFCHVSFNPVLLTIKLNTRHIGQRTDRQKVAFNKSSFHPTFHIAQNISKEPLVACPVSSESLHVATAIKVDGHKLRYVSPLSPSHVLLSCHT